MTQSNARYWYKDRDFPEIKAPVQGSSADILAVCEDPLGLQRLIAEHNGVVDELAALRAANACLVAGLEKADCTCDAEDSYYHSAGCYRCESLARARELLGGK
jgi:hypothetical protein